MLLDSTLVFDPAGTAITAGGPSTNVLDFGVAPVGGRARDMAFGKELDLVIVSSGTFAAGGAATLQISVQVSNDNATWFTTQSSAVLTIAQLNNLNSFKMPQALGGASGLGIIPRYYRLNYTVATGPFTAGTLQSYLNIGEEHPVSYAKNFTNA